MQKTEHTKQNKSPLVKMAKASRREEAKGAGYYDGRFRPRVVESRRHKKPKHKNALLDA